MALLSGRGTVFPILVVTWCLQQACCSKKSVALLFTDLKAALYSTLPEVAIGRFFGNPVRLLLLTKLGLSDDGVRAFQVAYVESPSILTQCGVAPAWAKAIGGWQSRTSFTVRNGARKIVPFAGTRPGDPLADAVFCLAFGCFLLP